MNAKRFVNFTSADFTWKQDGTAYTFKPGDPIFLEDFRADHFCKHLVDQELNRLGKPTNDPSRAVLEKQCFPTDEVTTSAEALNLTEISKTKKGKIAIEPEFEDLLPAKKKK